MVINNNMLLLSAFSAYYNARMFPHKRYYGSEIAIPFSDFYSSRETSLKPCL